MASSTRDHQCGGERNEREERGKTTRGSSNRRSPSVPERMCNTPVDERDLAPSQSNYAGCHQSKSPERERSSNRERCHSQGNSSARERSRRDSRGNTGEISYPTLENISRETLPPPYATNSPPGHGDRIPIVPRRQDTNPPPYATTAPSESENRIPIVLRRPNSSPLLPNADPLSPWQGNRTLPMARQYNFPIRPHSRYDGRNHNIRTPQFIPYASQRGNPYFEPARLHQFEYVPTSLYGFTSPRNASKVPETATDSSDAFNAANASNAFNVANTSNITDTSNIANITDAASTPTLTNVLRLVVLD